MVASSAGIWREVSPASCMNADMSFAASMSGTPQSSPTSPNRGIVASTVAFMTFSC